MKRLDSTLTSMFHMDWLVPMDGTTEDDYSRAVAEKADVLLRSARFMSEAHLATGSDMEVRLWVEAACGNACVSITWEPGVQRFAFHLLDESLRERLGCVVFHEIPCLDSEGSLAQADLILDAAFASIAQAEGRDPADLADAIRRAQGYTRVPVHEAEARQDD